MLEVGCVFRKKKEEIANSKSFLLDLFFYKDNDIYIMKLDIYIDKY